MHLKIFGSGIDIVDNIRIKKILEKYQDKFIEKIYSKYEVDFIFKKYFHINLFEEKEKSRLIFEIISNSKIINFFAKRFSAKESFLKSIGLGFNSLIKMKDISILNDKYNAPYIHLEEKIYKKLIYFIAKKTNQTILNLEFYISLSDEIRYSISQVITTYNIEIKNE
jgi:holo-[acyl-carrier protein] synthase